MPPANTPLDTPALTPAAPASSFQQLSAVSIPPSHPAESDDAHDDNVSFLRSRVRSPPESSSSSLSRQRRRRQQNLAEFDADPMDLDDPRNLRMSVEVNRRIPIVRRQDDSDANMPNYDGRLPNIRSLYGWAPGSDDDEDEDEGENPLIDSSVLSSWFGRLSDRNAASRRHARRDAVGRSPPTLNESAAESSHGTSSDHPLTTTEALLQSVRHQPRSSRTRSLHNYLLSQESEESRERSATSSTSRAYRYLPSSRGEPHRILTHGDPRSRTSARQMHMEHPPSPRLKETIKYLDRLRYSNSYRESITSAAAGGFMQPEYFPWNEDDFIIDTAWITPPPESSWLRPGMIFSGSQRAASNASVLSQRLPSSAQDPMIVNGESSNNSGNRISVFTTTGRRYLASNIYNFGGRDENWPVKVTIHDIDYREMTVSGTMEAYNIPDKTSPTHDAHIVTFLEGEIIDFNTHTLETKNFKADAEIDSTYWRELQPFKNLTDEEMTRNLVSRKWITEELSHKWILMRWKERCFITPTDSRQGLTISGFYYITLCRETGHIEGLYYDPGSSPYQQLALKPETEKMIRPSFSFR